MGARFSKGDYYMMVTRVEQKNSTFKRSGNEYYVYYVFFIDENGEEKIGEYVITAPTQDVFIAGKKINFRVTMNGTYGDEIEPILPGQSPRECHSQPKEFRGSPAALSMAYAKDMVVAQIAYNPNLKEEVMEANLVRFADVMYNWVSKKHAE